MRFSCFKSHITTLLTFRKGGKLQLKANVSGLEIKVCISGFDPVQDQSADPRSERAATGITLRLLPRQSDATLTNPQIRKQPPPGSPKVPRF